MFVLIFQILLAVALGGIVLLFASKIPAMLDFKEEEEKKTPSSFNMKQVVFETVRRAPVVLKEGGNFAVQFVSQKFAKEKIKPEEKPIKFDEDTDFWEKVKK